MILTINSPQVRRTLRRDHGMPQQPEDGCAQTFGPFKRQRSTLYWHYRGGDTWEVEEIEGRSLVEYMRLRGKVCRLADEYRGQMTPDELVTLLIQACIETELASRADIMDSVEFATMLNPADIGRVLVKHRGRNASRHLWWIDKNKMYHLY